MDRRLSKFVVAGALLGTIAASGGMFLGRITGKNKITVRFFLTATTYTSLDAKLTRKSSP
jgi:hypothetical protein